MAKLVPVQNVFLGRNGLLHQKIYLHGVSHQHVEKFLTLTLKILPMETLPNFVAYNAPSCRRKNQLNANVTRKGHLNFPNLTTTRHLLVDHVGYVAGQILLLHNAPSR